jgi:nucleotide-binding universal stress UspA family protein
MYKRILAAIDSSERSDRVLETVEGLARLTGAAVDVVHVDPSQIVYDTVVEVEDEQEAQAVVDNALARLKGAGVTAHGRVLTGFRGEIAGLVADQARELGSDLIVLGPGHHTKLGVLFGESVSEKVAFHTPTSVLLVV